MLGRKIRKRVVPLGGLVVYNIESLPMGYEHALEKSVRTN
jgi:hypothetical protein